MKREEITVLIILYVAFGKCNKLQQQDTKTMGVPEGLFFQ